VTVKGKKSNENSIPVLKCESKSKNGYSLIIIREYMAAIVP